VGDELPEGLYKDITLLSEHGNALSDAGRFEDAVTVFRQAWQLLPEPRDQWDAAAWLLVAIGDGLFLQGRHAEALEPLQRAVFCPGGLGHAFLHLRLGQVQFELENIPRAKDELARAFMGGGNEIFAEEDPKYWRFIREILRPSKDEVNGPDGGDAS
jgi:tetratricopeptide (TPR) repeat protein